MQCVLDKPVNDRSETVKLNVQDTESQIRYVTYQLKAKLLLLPHLCVPHRGVSEVMTESWLYRTPVITDTFRGCSY